MRPWYSGRRDPVDLGGSIIVAIAIVLGTLIAFSHYGCGGSGAFTATSQPRSWLSEAATSGRELEDAFVLLYQHQEAVARLGAEPGSDSYNDAMRPWHAAAEALVAFRDALIAAQSTLDAYDAGKDADHLGAIGCLAVALRQAVAALEVVRVTIPDVVHDTIRSSAGVERLCQTSSQAPTP